MYINFWYPIVRSEDLGYDLKMQEVCYVYQLLVPNRSQ